MAKLPRPSGKHFLEFLQREGFELVRTRGSHHVVRRGDVTTTVPVHGHRTLKIGTLRKILRDLDWGPTDFVERWHGKS